MTGKKGRRREIPGSQFSIQTERLILRDLTESDLPLVVELSREPDVTRYQDWFRLEDHDACKAFIQNLSNLNREEPRRAYNLVLVQRANSLPIGWLGFGDPEDPTKGDASLGYALLPSQWNRGYMTEAVRALLDFAFSSLAKKSIYATCAASNHASRRVLEKAGLRFVESWQEERSGIAEEHVRYRIEVSESAKLRAPDQSGRPRRPERGGHFDTPCPGRVSWPPPG
jgi:[ribosomal protein S5]-alanine N-acetyltransferase